MNIPTTAPAWWGSITGTIALVWQIFRWYRSGPRLKLSASANMQIISSGQPTDETLHVFLNVRNVGDAATTITHFCGKVYPSQLYRILGRKAQVFVITTGPIPMPHKLGAGETWSAYALQREFAKHPASSVILLGVQHSMSDKPQLVRVSLP